MKIKELRSMKEDELRRKLTEIKKELIKHNAQIATGTTPKNPGQVRQLKKTAARIMMILREQLGGVNQEFASPARKKQEV